MLIIVSLTAVLFIAALRANGRPKGQRAPFAPPLMRTLVIGPNHRVSPIPLMANLIIGIFTGALGMAYIVYGRRQAKFIPLLSGLGLCAYSYFIDSWVWLCVVGIVFVVIPFVIDF